MRRQLWLLAGLAAFVALVIAIAFVAAFRNTDAGEPSITTLRSTSTVARSGR
jgi:hypothetical protein